MKTSALLLTACLLSAPTFAAESPASESTSVSASRAGEVDLRALLRELGPKLHKRFVWDPRISQSIDLGTLDRKEMTYPDLLGLLDLNRMTVVAGEGVWRVIVIDDVRQAAMPFLAPGRINALDDEWITTVLPVKNVPAQLLVPTLRPFVATQGQLVALPDRNALIITDRSAHVKRLLEIIKALEEAPKGIDLAIPKNP